MTSLSPLVSVVIPTYNRPVYLKQAIESACQQTYSNLEIIVADDCSPESPEELVRSFNDPRIRFIRHPKNLGNGDNIAKAFQLAKGKYVAPLNDDDLWEPTFLEQLVPPLEVNPDLPAAFCNYYVADADGTINLRETEIGTRRWKREHLKEGIYQPFVHLGLIMKSFWASSYVVLRKTDIVWEELEGIGPFWDYFLVYLACREGKGAYYCPERLARYRKHEGAEHRTNGRKNPEGKIRKSMSGIVCCEHFLSDPRVSEYWNYFENHLASRYTSVALGLLWLGESKMARDYLIKAFNYKKTDWKTILAFGLSFIPEPLAFRLGIATQARARPIN